MGLYSFTLPLKHGYSTLLSIIDVADGFLTLPMCTQCKKVYAKALPDVCRNIRYDGNVCNTTKPETVELFAYKPISRALGDIVSRIPNFDEL